MCCPGVWKVRERRGSEGGREGTLQKQGGRSGLYLTYGRQFGCTLSGGFLDVGFWSLLLPRRYMQYKERNDSDGIWKFFTK